LGIPSLQWSWHWLSHSSRHCGNSSDLWRRAWQCDPIASARTDYDGRMSGGRIAGKYWCL
jgi:hypothetical protein